MYGCGVMVWLRDGVLGDMFSPFADDGADIVVEAGFPCGLKMFLSMPAWAVWMRESEGFFSARKNLLRVLFSSNTMIMFDCCSQMCCAGMVSFCQNSSPMPRICISTDVGTESNMGNDQKPFSSLVIFSVLGPTRRRRSPPR